MRKIDDNELSLADTHTAIDSIIIFSIPILGTRRGWSIMQWSAIITSTIALCLHYMMSYQILTRKQRHSPSKVALLIHWCMVWAFVFHAFRFIRETVDLIRG